jgi:hypothetical protein
MRVRALDQNGDMQFGFGSQNFFIDNLQLVQQKVITGLKLWQGEFFLDTTAGMPWNTKVLGVNTQSLYDAAIQQQIKGTTGVTGIASYSSSFNSTTRQLNVNVMVMSQFGNFTISLPFALPLLGGYGVLGYGIGDPES